MRPFPFEPVIGIQFHTMRAGHVIASILYDRDVPGHDEQALACHDKLFQVLNENGFIPYRLNTRGMNARLPSDASYAALMKSLKNAIDPLGILAPGRYE
jgi:4-cresol dehydrogenase (hydroxylating)